MRKIRVELGCDSYEIYVGADLLVPTARWLHQSFSGKLVIISHPSVMKLHGEVLAHYLTDEGFKVITLLVPEGEEQKSLESATRLYQELTDAYAERSTPVIALGGGVIGDLAGFVAATYMRGLPLIQMPTTLLAQVDSSIGGKVAVDHGRLKNKIGSFYQPGLVVADVDALTTLPAIEFTNGLAEVIKTAAIRDKELFAFLETNMAKIKSLDCKLLEEVVFRTASIKTEIVEKDERDLNVRGLLNYGHTIGHAIESVSGFGVKHGQAVAIGMVAAAKISNKMGLISVDELNRLKSLIQSAGLPVDVPSVKVSDVMQAMKHDKKVQQDKVRFVLLKSIGNAYITDEVSPSLVEQVLSEA
ncbi:MAG: 3-dehydroquinate synthase [Dehalococcoidales bacterium]|nr:3-dehydroquinate synthase [Dehalococcoidales bacterium]